MMILPFSARLRGTLFTLTLTLLSGCALIQDEPAQVAIVNPQQAQLAQVIHLANSDWPAARWWEAYDDPQLNMLINRALQNSPTMQAARLRNLPVAVHGGTRPVGNGPAGHRRRGAKPPADHRQIL
ncbi:tripartite multidrug resistance system outer membrane protein [Klebsiella pneumoniae]|uniref:Tripartite multidrug resistance system outer membrane protein n=1 Tax=Klebsiella pneumoniae TaxID=573 RepID=A0A377VW05_KLEPN|nr:tripartite multidrug resistance system outer membrane protein [Klebsiella pneumoniae]